MKPKSFVVVGAGVGGLATALRLAHLGHKVTVFEKNGYVGGRNRSITVGGSTFDAGPTLLMMLDPFRKLFEDVGEKMEDHLEIVPCNPNYRVFFSDRTTVDCTTDVDKMVDQIRQIAGPGDAENYPKMLADFKALYEQSIPQFVRRNYDSLLDLIRPRSLQIALRHRMLGNLAKGMARYFQDERLRILFCLQTMYLGLSPNDAPLVYAVLVYMEYGEGIWYPKGGMVRISESIAELGRAKGVQIELNSTVCSVDGKSVLLESGSRVTADAVIVNADLPYAEKEIVRPSFIRKKAPRYSCSAYMMYIDYSGQIPELLHHNIVLGSNFDENLDQLFNRFEIPSDPAFYVAISSKTDPTKSESGHKNLFILVPCPNLNHPFSDEDGAAIQQKVFDRLERESTFNRAQVLQMKTFSPSDWEREFNLTLGAAFGVSHDLFQSVCFRPSNKSRSAEGVYYVGASTNPGNGLPMVLIGAELVEARLRSDGII